MGQWTEFDMRAVCQWVMPVECNSTLKWLLDTLQAQKFAGVDDPIAIECIQNIMEAKSPEEAARFGRSLARQQPHLVFYLHHNSNCTEIFLDFQTYGSDDVEGVKIDYKFRYHGDVKWWEPSILVSVIQRHWHLKHSIVCCVGKALTFFVTYLVFQVRPNWESEKLVAMQAALHVKFTSYPALRELLTSTAGAVLVEASQNDNFWGAGRNGAGENKLGHMLMELRSKFLEEAQGNGNQNGNWRTLGPPTAVSWCWLHQKASFSGANILA